MWRIFVFASLKYFVSGKFFCSKYFIVTLCVSFFILDETYALLQKKSNPLLSVIIKWHKANMCTYMACFCKLLASQFLNFFLSFKSYVLCDNRNEIKRGQTTKNHCDHLFKIGWVLFWNPIKCNLNHEHEN